MRINFPRRHSMLIPWIKQRCYVFLFHAVDAADLEYPEYILHFDVSPFLLRGLLPSPRGPRAVIQALIPVKQLRDLIGFLALVLRANVLIVSSLPHPTEPPHTSDLSQRIHLVQVRTCILHLGERKVPAVSCSQF